MKHGNEVPRVSRYVSKTKFHRKPRRRRWRSKTSNDFRTYFAPAERSRKAHLTTTDRGAQPRIEPPTTSPRGPKCTGFAVAAQGGFGPSRHDGSRRGRRGRKTPFFRTRSYTHTNTHTQIHTRRRARKVYCVLSSRREIVPISRHTATAVECIQQGAV